MVLGRVRALAHHRPRALLALPEDYKVEVYYWKFNLPTNLMSVCWLVGRVVTLGFYLDKVVEKANVYQYLRKVKGTAS